MNAKAVLAGLDSAFRNGIAHVTDPGASGTFQVENKGVAIAIVVTAGAESRALPAADGFGEGQELTVMLKTAGGNLTVTGAESSVVMTTAGDVSKYVVSISGSTKVWRLVSFSGAALASLNSAPVALGVADINTGDAATDTALIGLANALQTLGLVTHTWT